MARLTIPGDFISQLTLLSNIKAKNDEDGATSPLIPFLTQQGINLNDDAAAGNAAQAHETNRALLAKQSENFRQLRDNYFKTGYCFLLLFSINSSITFGKYLYSNSWIRLAKDSVVSFS